ncbi:hypothetical protein [Thalassovita mangrovi]|uniref:Uncharacterized protein n=1 Tax=Thalassovita mangrovi TaxID=2692236 RepID=A0A6L8LF07_9RHOB|nr:hypothetical protein [Thalassovita mangrovi]MYM54594.1 hypothetical protein [Thalassovita mangrovi]
MLDVFLMLVAMAAQGAGEARSSSMAEVAAEPAPVTESAAPTEQAAAQAAPQPAPQPAPEVPSGKFTTAQEVRPILGMTKANWIAVREYDGQDIVYFTQLLSWRCGLNAIRYSFNDGPIQVYPLPPCHDDTASPNALIDDEAMPIMGLAPGSVQKVYVEIFYDDMTTDSASFERKAVLMP